MFLVSANFSICFSIDLPRITFNHLKLNTALRPPKASLYLENSLHLRINLTRAYYTFYFGNSPGFFPSL